MKMKVDEGDLIETLWNVKRRTLTNICSGPCRFNRDIVECKDVYHIDEDFQATGFNRDIVECKGFYHCSEAVWSNSI